MRTADPEAFNRTIAVNLVGVYRTVSAAVPHLAASRGYVLVVASVASVVPLPGVQVETQCEGVSVLPRPSVRAAGPAQVQLARPGGPYTRAPV